MNKYFKIFFVLGCSLLGISAMAQNYMITQRFLTKKDGLSASLVNDACQDSKGFLWIATNNGLDRYDGQNFEHISIPSNLKLLENLHFINEDVNGLLWCSTVYARIFRAGFVQGYSKLTIYDPIRNVGIPFDQKFPNCPFLQTQLIEIQEGKNNVLCFILNNGEIWSYDGDYHKIFDSQTYDFSTRVFPSLRGTYWLSIKNHLYEVNQSGSIIHDDTLETNIDYLFELSDSTLFFKLKYDTTEIARGSRPLHFIKKQNQRSNPFFTKEYTAYDWIEEGKYKVQEDKQRNLWCLSRSGNAIFDFAGNLLYDLEDEMEKFQLGERMKFLTFADGTAIFISIATGKEGLLSLEIKNQPFQKYLYNGPNLISTRGIAKLNDSTFHVNNYFRSLFLNIKTGQYEYLNHPVSLYYKGYGIAKDKMGNVFSGIHGFDVIRSDIRGKYLGNYKPDKSILDSLELRNLLLPFVDQKNKLWVATFNHLLYLNETTKSFKLFNQLNGVDDFSTATINHFYENSEGIWLATSNGVYLLDVIKGIIQYHDDFISNSITHIYEDKEGVFWLGTVDNGLIKWNRKTEEKENFNEKHGFSDNAIHAIFEDDFERLWMSSNFGLMQFDKNSKQVKNFFKEDGITHNEFNKASYFQDEDGTIYLGGLNGITAFHPSDFRQTKKVERAKPVVTKLEKTDASSGEILDLTQTFFRRNKITMKPGDKSFVIRFALLDFSHSHQEKYTYAIEGFEENWTAIKENFIRVNQLPYGTFNLKIKGMGSGETWGEELVVPIEVIKPFYLKNWFIVLASLTGVLFVWSFIRFRIYRLRKRAEDLAIEVFNRTKIIEKQKNELEASNKVKDRFLALIGHDLKTPLISLKGMTQKLNFLIKENRYDDIARLSTSIDQSSSNMTKLLDNLLNWALLQKNQFDPKPEVLDLNALVDETIVLYQNIAISKKIDFKIIIPDQFQLLMDRNALLTILRNLVDNAIKYTPNEGWITLEAKTENNQAKIQIENSGSGMAENAIQNVFEASNRNDNGLGLLICKELVAKNKGVFKIANVNNQSTLVLLILPQPTTSDDN